MSSISQLFTRGYSSKSSRPKENITLDAQQSSIVHSTSPNIIVVAGAGSGKTRVITERVKYLLDSGVTPHNIVAITFTNLAAEEMRERLQDTPGIGDTFIGTIHSFANKIMQVSGETYKLYNDELDSLYHKELIQKYCHFLSFDRYLAYKDLYSEYELGKYSEEEVSKFFSPSERTEYNILHRSPEAIQKEVETLGSTDYPESIQTLCLRDSVITFDELLVKADNYFRSIGASVEHLLVDEFQDVGSLEFNFIAGLNAENNFFVGDDYQSIYGFKGGNVSLFLRLVEDSNFDTFYLTNNYRNCREVLNLADIVISQVNKKIPKTITRKVDEDGEVVIQSKGRLHEALQGISDYKNWFILARTNKELFHIVEVCQDLRIPFVTFKREGLSLSELRANMNSNRVKILTVHTAKGLEADNVILYGKFPVRCPAYLNNEDERKVMYVGVTRARKKLILLN